MMGKITYFIISEVRKLCPEYFATTVSGREMNVQFSILAASSSHPRVVLKISHVGLIFWRQMATRMMMMMMTTHWGHICATETKLLQLQQQWQG
jgi:hypothetical protein